MYTTIVHARPVQHTTAVVQANGITTKMEVYGFYEVGDHLHLMATPIQWRRESSTDKQSWQPSAHGHTTVITPRDYTIGPDDVVRFAPSAVNTTVSLYYTN